jgi:hypothetical protein
VKTLLTFLCLTACAFARDIRFEWDAVPDPDVIYDLLLGTNVVATTTNTSATVTNVPAGKHTATVIARDIHAVRLPGYSEPYLFEVLPGPKNLRIQLSLQKTARLGEPWQDVQTFAAFDAPAGEQAFYRAQLRTD